MRAHVPPRLAVPVLIGLALLSAGCVSKSAHEELEAKLAACENDRNSARGEADDLRGHLDKDDARWQALQAQLGQVLPQVQADFETERQRIVGLVPAQVRQQVGESLDRHFGKVSQSFLEMSQSMGTLRTELESARDEIAMVRTSTEDVGTRVDRTHEAAVAENQRLQAELAGQRRKAGELVARLSAFDATHLNCADCADRLKMKDRSRDQLLALHAELVSQLSALQGGGP